MMPPFPVLTFIGAVALALVHVAAGSVVHLRDQLRGRWLSLAGGVSVAYVFIHVLPELSHGQEIIEELDILTRLEYDVFVMALAGLATFYGLEQAAKRNEQTGARRQGVYLLHVGSFAIYNALVGYLLVHRETPGALNLTLFVVALGLHFVVNDAGLVERFATRYERRGRWVLVGAILVGWAVGMLTEIGEAVLALLYAFLAGGIVLNVLKEELPEGHASSFGAFALGMAAYTVLLLAL
jgi:zinc transporter ZupT